MKDLDLTKALEFLNQPFYESGKISFSLFTVGFWIGILFMSWIVSRIAQRLLRSTFDRREVNQGTTAATSRLLHYLIMAIGLSIAFESTGISLATLFAAGAVFAIGIGFALQTLTQNFVSGLILLLERSIKPGDILKVEDQFVRVEYMAIRSTRCRTLDDEEIIVPNSTLVQSTVTNYTLGDSYYRLRTTVGVTYSSDMVQVRRVLEATAGQMSWRYKGKKPVILMTEFADSAVNWEVSVWIDDPWRVRARRSELNEAIWNGLKAERIVIAFPQLDVHFDAPVVEMMSNKCAG